MDCLLQWKDSLEWNRMKKSKCSDCDPGLHEVRLAVASSLKTGPFPAGEKEGGGGWGGYSYFFDVHIAR